MLLRSSCSKSSACRGKQCYWCSCEDFSGKCDEWGYFYCTYCWQAWEGKPNSEAAHVAAARAAKLAIVYWMGRVQLKQQPHVYRHRCAEHTPPLLGYSHPFIHYMEPMRFGVEGPVTSFVPRLNFPNCSVTPNRALGVSVYCAVQIAIDLEVCMVQQPTNRRNAMRRAEANAKWGALHFGQEFRSFDRFVSFVRAYARSGCLVELDLESCGSDFSLFPFVQAQSCTVQSLRRPALPVLSHQMG